MSELLPFERPPRREHRPEMSGYDPNDPNDPPEPMNWREVGAALLLVSLLCLGFWLLLMAAFWAFLP